jgi:transposase
MKNRKRHTKEFKEGAVRMVTEQKRSMSDVAKNLEVTAWTISRWVKEASKEGEEAFRGNGNRTAEEQEIAELKRQIRQLEEERAILKKAAAYFARHVE